MGIGVEQSFFGLMIHLCLCTPASLCLTFLPMTYSVTKLPVEGKEFPCQARLTGLSERQWGGGRDNMAEAKRWVAARTKSFATCTVSPFAHMAAKKSAQIGLRKHKAMLRLAVRLRGATQASSWEVFSNRGQGRGRAIGQVSGE